MSYFRQNQQSVQFIKHHYTVREVVDLVYCKTRRHPRVYGRGYMLLCPAHREKNPSLSICEGDNGAILMHCFKGCGIQDICNSIGIPVSALFPPKRGR